MQRVRVLGANSAPLFPCSKNHASNGISLGLGFAICKMGCREGKSIKCAWRVVGAWLGKIPFSPLHFSMRQSGARELRLGGGGGEAGWRESLRGQQCWPGWLPGPLNWLWKVLPQP
jgi:hypothetical protein